MEKFELLKIAKDAVGGLDPSFLFLKTSFKSLTVYEILQSLFSAMGVDLAIADDVSVEEKKNILDSKLNQLKESDIDAIKTAFFLGILAMTLIHANIPLSDSLLEFGQVLNSEYQN